MPMSSVRPAAIAALLACTALWGAAAHAQVYRIVGPDGRVTFSDRPPAEGQATPAPSVALPASTGAPGSVALPSDLRAVVSRFPVVLYTTQGCTPCETARSFLAGRGVPFTEKTISTDADVRALRSLSGDEQLPFATLGAQHLVGFSDAEWSQYMDAAGYPKTSALPPGYRNPAPSPLVAVAAPRRAASAARAPAQAAAPAPAEPQPLPSDPSPSNPLGLRF
jgi:glutaredoxin